MKYFKTAVALLAASMFFAGCNTTPFQDGSVYQASFTSEPIKIDGKLNEATWSKAAVLGFNPLPGSGCTENGKVRIIWDKKYVYIGAVLKDSDIVQESDTNGSFFYRTGDVLEVFIRPVGKRCYWEIYGTPNNKKSSFLFPSKRKAKGRAGLAGSIAHEIPGLKTAAVLNGTLNNDSNRDTEWTIEMAIPINELEKSGIKIAPGEKWIFHIGRYNYSSYLENKELTTTGYPTINSFHEFSAWNRLKFVK